MDIVRWRVHWPLTRSSAELVTYGFRGMAILGRITTIAAITASDTILCENIFALGRSRDVPLYCHDSNPIVDEIMVTVVISWP